MVSLRTQAVIVFAISFALLMGGFYWAFSEAILRGFSALEQQTTRQQIERVLHAIELGMVDLSDGRLDVAERKRVEEVTGARFTINKVSRVKLPAVEPIDSPLLGGTRLFIETPKPESGNNRLINGYALLPSRLSGEELVMEIILPRTIFQQAEEGLGVVRWSLLGVGILLSVVTLVLVELLLVRRLLGLRREIRTLQDSNDLSSRVGTGGRDEVTEVARAFNDLLSSIEAEHKRRAAHLARLAAQNKELVALTQSTVLTEGDLPAALATLTEVAAKTLGADSASLWRFRNDSQELHCEDMYERAQDRHSAAFTIKTATYRDYAHAMRTERIIAAEDCRTDPRTREFTDAYFKPLGITSMLIAPIRVAGEVLGAICVEHVGPTRAWTEDEQAFLASLGDFYNVAFASAQRRRAETELHAYKTGTIPTIV